MNAYTLCAQDYCVRSPADGDVLYRVNPKGEPGVFMCREHADDVEREAIEADARRCR